MIEKIKQIFQNGGCILLSTEYKNQYQKLNYLCSCGNEAIIDIAHFKRGHRCKNCRTDRRKKTNLEKYGVENVSQLKEIQDKINHTNLEKYGGHYSQTSEYKKRVEKTCLEKFGVKKAGQSKEIQEKRKRTKLERYGDENYVNREKAKQTCLEKYGVEYPGGLFVPITKSSSYEDLLEEELWEMGYLKWNKPLDDCPNIRPDFLNPDTKEIIEIYGDYWHCNPKIYEEDYWHKQLKMSAGDKWLFDKTRINMLTLKGYKVKIIWETEIKNGEYKTWSF